MSFVPALSLKNTIDEINEKTGLEFVYNHATGEFVSADHWLYIKGSLFKLAYPSGFGKKHLITTKIDQVIERINERERI